MRCAAASLLFAAMAVGCSAEEPADSDKIGHVRLPAGFEPVGGAAFTIEVTPGRSPAWILSREGERLYVLYDRKESSPPHYFELGEALDVPAVLVNDPLETLVWPEDLGHGDYELCNSGRDDWCVTITVR